MKACVAALALMALLMAGQLEAAAARRQQQTVYDDQISMESRQPTEEVVVAVPSSSTSTSINRELKTMRERFAARRAQFELSKLNQQKEEQPSSDQSEDDKLQTESPLVVEERVEPDTLIPEPEAISQVEQDQDKPEALSQVQDERESRADEDATEEDEGEEDEAESRSGTSGEEEEEDEEDDEEEETAEDRMDEFSNDDDESQARSGSMSESQQADVESSRAFQRRLLNMMVSEAKEMMMAAMPDRSIMETFRFMPLLKPKYASFDDVDEIDSKSTSSYDKPKKKKRTKKTKGYGSSKKPKKQKGYGSSTKTKKPKKQKGYGKSKKTKKPEPAYGVPKPHSTYGTPTSTYSAPSPSYSAPSTYTAPSSSYSAPATYTAPSSSYSAPATYSAPSSSYSAPSSSYGTPKAKPVYSAPTQTYGAPAATYSAPSSSYGAPAATYSAPSSSYGAPAQTYGAPAATYSAPSSSYGAPTQTYGAPAPTYSAPAAYSAPTQTAYVQPQVGYGGAAAPSVTSYGQTAPAKPSYSAAPTAATPPAPSYPAAPAAPAYNPEPAKPQYSAPTRPPYSPPAEPEYVVPPAPSAYQPQKPSKPQYSAPTRPPYSPPSEPEYEAPIAPIYPNTPYQTKYPSAGSSSNEGGYGNFGAGFPGAPVPSDPFGVSFDFDPPSYDPPKGNYDEPLFHSDSGYGGNTNSQESYGTSSGGYSQEAPSQSGGYSAEAPIQEDPYRSAIIPSANLPLENYASPTVVAPAAVQAPSDHGNRVNPYASKPSDNRPSPLNYRRKPAQTPTTTSAPYVPTRPATTFAPYQPPPTQPPTQAPYQPPQTTTAPPTPPPTTRPSTYPKYPAFPPYHNFDPVEEEPQPHFEHESSDEVEPTSFFGQAPPTAHPTPAAPEPTQSSDDFFNSQQNSFPNYPSQAHDEGSHVPSFPDPEIPHFPSYRQPEEPTSFPVTEASDKPYERDQELEGREIPEERPSRRPSRPRQKPRPAANDDPFFSRINNDDAYGPFQFKEIFGDIGWPSGEDAPFAGGFGGKATSAPSRSRTSGGGSERPVLRSRSGASSGSASTTSLRRNRPEGSRKPSDRNSDHLVGSFSAQKPSFAALETAAENRSTAEEEDPNLANHAPAPVTADEPAQAEAKVEIPSRPTPFRKPSLAKRKPGDESAARPSGSVTVSPAERRAAQRERLQSRRVQQKPTPTAESE